MNKNKLLKRKRLLRKLFYICCLSLMFFNYGLSQDVPYVDEISYSHTESHRLALPSGTSFDDLHAYDMPSLEYKEMSYQMKKSLDDNGNPQTLQTLTGAINFYEDWQRLAEQWLFNQEGTTLYTAEGKGRNKTYHISDAIDHSKMSLEIYQDNKTYINKFGYLTSRVFPNKIRDILMGNTSQNGSNTFAGTSYIITPNGSMVMTNAGGEYIIYKVIKNEDGDGIIGVVTQIKYQEDPDVLVYPVFPDGNDPNVITMSISVFDIEICGELFLSSTTEVIKEVLFNGLCAKRIIENTYSQYEFNCQETAARFSKNIDLVEEMRLSPNPLRSDLLSISLPLSLDNEEMKITIMSLSGQHIGELSQKVKGNLLHLNVGDIISSQGLYIISVQSTSYTNTKKIFYTQN